jgi:hypothetical protein
MWSLLTVAFLLVTPRTGHGQDSPAAEPSASVPVRRARAIGVQFSSSDLGVGMTALSVAGSYSPRPFYALGGELGVFRTDQGSDSGNCEGCTLGIVRAGPFGELPTPWAFHLNFFARGTVGAVIANRTRVRSPEIRRGGIELDLWAQIAAGPELRLGAVYFRPSGHAGTFGGAETWLGWGLELGGAF